MTWTALHHRAQQLGFELACHTRVADGGYVPELSSPPGHDRSWVCVGLYDQMAGLWAQPMTAQNRALPAERIAAIISGCSQHVATLADYDDEFHASLRTAVNHPDYGRMPA